MPSSTRIRGVDQKFFCPDAKVAPGLRRLTNLFFRRLLIRSLISLHPLLPSTRVHVKLSAKLPLTTYRTDGDLELDDYRSTSRNESPPFSGLLFGDPGQKGNKNPVSRVKRRHQEECVVNLFFSLSLNYKPESMFARVFTRGPKTRVHRSLHLTVEEMSTSGTLRQALCPLLPTHTPDS